MLVVHRKRAHLDLCSLSSFVAASRRTAHRSFLNYHALTIHSAAANPGQQEAVGKAAVLLSGVVFLEVAPALRIVGCW